MPGHGDRAAGGPASRWQSAPAASFYGTESRPAPTPARRPLPGASAVQLFGSVRAPPRPARFVAEPGLNDHGCHPRFRGEETAGKAAWVETEPRTRETKIGGGMRQTTMAAQFLRLIRCDLVETARLRLMNRVVPRHSSGRGVGLLWGWLPGLFMNVRKYKRHVDHSSRKKIRSLPNSIAGARSPAQGAATVSSLKKTLPIVWRLLDPASAGYSRGRGHFA